MKIANVTTKHCNNAIKVNDCKVGDGYLQGLSGSLPDVDVDYQSDRRQDVKEYTERRYNHHNKNGDTTCFRVLSAGTMTTLKAKAVIKDVARTMRIPVNTVNYITSMIDDDKADWTELFRMAKTNKKLGDFIERYPKLFEDIRSLMLSPRSSSVHASALLITPDEKDGKTMECFDFIPIKRVGDMLVSENTGVELDSLGLLKNDCLATKELSKSHEKINLINNAYGLDLTFDKLAIMAPNDPDVYAMLADGYTCDVFQFSSKGITNMLKEIHPTYIEDLIAVNAVYRPATLDSGTADDFVNRHNGLCDVKYYWGTEEILKNTFGVLVFQEQMSLVAQKVGKFSVSESIALIKKISKKKKDAIKAARSKFMEGALAQGCPEEDANAIFDVFEAAGRYCFNRSHSTAYAITAYIGAYLKCKFPTASYAVSLQWAEEKKELPAIMQEMEVFSKTTLKQPDINRSGLDFTPDFETDEILWSLTKIKQCTPGSMKWVIDERERNGAFASMEDFMDRMLDYKVQYKSFWADEISDGGYAEKCAINSRHIINLIFAGAFDKVENIQEPEERWNLVLIAADKLGIKRESLRKDFPDELVDKHYFWSQKQQIVSGFGAINYKNIFQNSSVKPLVKGKCSYRTLDEIADEKITGRKVAICCTISSCDEHKYTSSQTRQQETMCKLILQQGTSIAECVIWADQYYSRKHQLEKSKGKIAIFTAVVRFSDFHNKNELQFTNSSILEVI